MEIETTMKKVLKNMNYESALKRAKEIYTYYCDDREQLRKLEYIFPELKCE